MAAAGAAVTVTDGTEGDNRRYRRRDAEPSLNQNAHQRPTPDPLNTHMTHKPRKETRAE